MYVRLLAERLLGEMLVAAKAAGQLQVGRWKSREDVVRNDILINFN
jgi:hypothetical protein